MHFCSEDVSNLRGNKSLIAPQWGIDRMHGFDVHEVLYLNSETCGHLVGVLGPWVGPI